MSEPTRPVPPPRRRASDGVEAIDRLVDSQLQLATLGGRPLANLAAAMAIEHAAAGFGALLLEMEDGLETVLALEGGLEAAASRRFPDATLVAQAAASRRLARDRERLAAPILVAGASRGCLYLEDFDGEDGEDVARLAVAAAGRIATLLRNAELVDEVARRTREVQLLESLGESFSSRQLDRAHLDRALAAAIEATGSDEGVLALLNPSGEPVEVLERGAGLGELAAGVARHLAAGGEPAEVLDAGAEYLYESLWSDLLAPPPAGGGRPSLGFLVVRRRSGAAYGEGDRTFFRALVHLLAGALARVDYLLKAAEDPLTAIGSRLALQLQLGEARERALATSRPFSILLVDVDRFKEVNDAHGHQVGDELLRAIAGLLNRRLRAGDFVARYGGDEFVMILPATAAAEAAELGRQVLELARQERVTSRQLPVSLSIGVAAFDPERDDLNRLVRQADLAMYAAKSAGGSQVRLYRSASAGAGARRG